jgi:hypothetical protein
MRPAISKSLTPFDNVLGYCGVIPVTPLRGKILADQALLHLFEDNVGHIDLRGLA